LAGKPEIVQEAGGRIFMDADKKRTIEARLGQQRQELILKRLGIEESWQNLHLNEIELAEKATNESLAAGLTQLDAQDKRKIEAIDHALSRIQSELYDICENCGGTISEKRLDAVPWTTLCIDCAAELERINNRTV
jgi:RNA polymerase-binding transcription factor DksA